MAAELRRRLGQGDEGLCLASESRKPKMQRDLASEAKPYLAVSVPWERSGEKEYESANVAASLLMLLLFVPRFVRSTNMRSHS